jgi:hypothetical protein
LHLATGSDLIDKGVSVGFPYVGAAPDLGAFEYGASTPDGGGSGAAGSAGAGGSGAGGNSADGGGASGSGAGGDSGTGAGGTSGGAAGKAERRQGAPAAAVSVVAQGSVAQGSVAEASVVAEWRMQRRDPVAWAVRQEGHPPARAARRAEAMAGKRGARVA